MSTPDPRLRNPALAACGALVLAGLIAWWTRPSTEVDPAPTPAALSPPWRRPVARPETARPPPLALPPERPAPSAADHQPLCARGYGCDVPYNIVGDLRGLGGVSIDNVYLSGCGADRSHALDSDGDFFLHNSFGADCVLTVFRTSGGFHLPGGRVQIEAPQDGSDVHVSLDVPPFAPAGLGVELGPRDDPFRLGRIYPGTGAEAAGLRTGDRILFVDGTSTDGMDWDDFRRLAMGPTGTEVEVGVVAPDGDEIEWATVRRQPLALDFAR